MMRTVVASPCHYLSRHNCMPKCRRFIKCTFFPLQMLRRLLLHAPDFRNSLDYYTWSATGLHALPVQCFIDTTNRVRYERKFTQSRYGLR